MSDKNKHINRRDFFKIVGVGTAAATLYSCGPKGAQSIATGSNASLPVPTDKMTYRTLNTGDKVSLLGYGCMRFPMIPGPDGKGDIVDQDVTNQLVDYAIAHGVNYFDTSPVYLQGQSERATGTALKKHPRDKVYIATKLSNFSNYTHENSVALYRKSFEELQTDYIDYYLLHAVGGSIQNFQDRFVDNGMMDFLLKEREAGRIRKLGFSFHGLAEVYDYALSLHDKYHWDFVQIQLNYMDWKHAGRGNVNADYLYGELVKREIPAVVMEPLLGGRLSKLPDHIVSRLKQRNPEGSVASWAFRFAGQPEWVLTSLSGMAYMEHLQDNIRTYAPLQLLTDDDKKFLEETAQLVLKYPTIPCNDCKYCMPCVYGIDIPAILLYYNKCVNEGSVPKDQGDENYKKYRRSFLVGYDRAIPKLRQADHCTGCNKCVEQCPQKIKIPRELQRIDQFVEQLKQETL